MDRNELAARFAVALAPSYYGQGYGDDDLARDAAHKADALMSVLAESSKSTPAPVAPPATVGEGLDDIERSAQALADFKGTIPPGASDAFMLGWRVRDREAPCDGVARTTNAPTPAPEAGDNLSESAHEQIRRLAQVIMTEIPGEPSTSESAVECAIRLLRKAYAPAPELSPPAPEAKRPTVDRAYDRVVAVRDYLDLLVSIQPETRRITAALAASIGYVLPTPCPPPVAGSESKDEALRRAAERILDSASRLSRSARPLGVGGCGHSVHSGVLGEVESDIDDLRSALSRPVRP